jgi:hypothetical protein
MTAQHELPAPLVPADTDISGFGSFMLDVDRLFASELWALSSGEEFKAAVALWGRAWQQTPAGSLPDDERLLAAFSGAGKRWPKVREVAMRGFVKCSDGRFYHRVLCEDVLKAARLKRERLERTHKASEARRRKGDDSPNPPSSGKKLNGVNETGNRHDQRHDDRNDVRDDHRNDVRHEHRHDAHAQTVTTNVTCSHRQDRTGPNSRRESQPPALQPDPASQGPGAAAGAAAVPRDWNTRENFDRVERRCREVLPGTWVVDPLVSPIVRLEADGLDLEREIIPAILDIVAGSRVPIRTWSLLANRIAERVAAQRASRVAAGLGAVPQAAAAPEDLVDLGAAYGRHSEASLRQAIANFRSTGNWFESVFGPPPGVAGCRVPARLLIAEAA